MAFLRINGLDVSAMVDDFELLDVSVEGYERTVSDSLEGVTYAVKKQITFTTEPLTRADAVAIEGWVRGRGHYWSFSRTDAATTRFSLNSNEGGLTFSTGTSGASGFFGAHSLQVDNAASRTATAQFGSNGDWTIAFYTANGSSPDFIATTVKSLAGTRTNSLAGVSVATIACISVTAASGFLEVRLRGRLASTPLTSATASFDELRVMPYSVTTAMLGALQTTSWIPTGGPALMPYVTVSGDALQNADIDATSTGEPGPITMKGFVESFQVEPMVIGGAFTYNGRRLRVKLVEK